MKQKKHDYEVAYICNGKNPKCKGRDGCYYGKPVGGIKGGCLHTQNPKCALNGAIDDHPRNYPERFERFTCETKDGRLVRYYEKLSYGE